ncbi:HD-GYP domain-containing protein [Clostridium ganghwense]|uniref:HD-GYP domain-containing protein n=1 Tax=Clostridium ganghwense TaxID=312089 RepID=A0ABT4CKQ8_9CLOT|nr:HD-GYP domain-containing protein [Clostridium ganghwense]MCY6369635.1 HD-GYP domain-containing protein [Clostridium ganghwense]
MDKNVKELNVNELLPGMILAREIRKNGVKLLDKDVILNSKFIEKIKKVDYLLQVLVYDNEDEDKQIHDFIVKSIKKLNEKEKVFGEISNKLDNICKEIEVNSKISMTELRNVQKNLLEESKDYSSTMRSIINGRDVDEYIYRHSINVGILSNMLGKWIGLSVKDLNLLTYAGILHDIGKIRIDSKILNKKSKLTSEEFRIIKTHSVIGYEIVKHIPYMDENVSMGVLMHHERCDGSGYPLKLKDEKIHTFGKIIAIADEFDAMTSNRVYKKKQSPFKVLEIMQEEALSKLDFKFWSIFLNGMVNCYIGEMVKLNTGDVAKVVRMDINDISRPLLLVKDDFIDLKERKDIFIEDLI